MPLPLTAIPTDGLTAFWNFDSNLTENHPLASGNMAPFDSYHLDLKQGVLSRPVPLDPNGFIGAAARFSRGKEHYLELANGGEVVEDDPLSNFTLSVRFKIDRVPSKRERFMLLETSPNFTFSLGLRVASETETLVQFYTDTIRESDPSISFTLPNETITGKWTHALATWDGVRFTAWVNEQFQTIELPSDDTLEPFNDFHIGTYREANGRFFDGLIDELAIWNRVLTSEELIGLQSIIRVDSVEDHVDENDRITTLREAIARAPKFSTIFFEPSLSGKTIVLSGSELLIDKSLTIDASDLPEGITIDAGGNGDLVQDRDESRCLKISDGVKRHALTVSLYHLTLQNGSHAGEEGGSNLYNDGENMILRNCRILRGRAFGSEAVKGGGISNKVGNLWMDFCNISHNQTSGKAGGGVYNDSGSLVLTSCVVSNNRSLAADKTNSGIFNQKGSLTLDSCTISLE